MKRLQVFLFNAFPMPNRRPLRLETLWGRHREERSDVARSRGLERPWIASPRAFSSQVETPDDSENATIQEVRALSVLIQSKPKALYGSR
jgi:hypothetical protein